MTFREDLDDGMRKRVIQVYLIGCFLISVGCDLWIAGSARTGYRVVIETHRVDGSEIDFLLSKLEDEGYRFMWKQRQVDGYGLPRYPDEVYTLMTRMTKKVDVYFNYVEDKGTNAHNHLRVSVENWFTGGIDPEIRNEIDLISGLIHEHLVKVVSGEHVSLERFGKISEKY